MLTDPPYFVRYKDRSGRTIRNDRYPGQSSTPLTTFTAAEAEQLCVSFYGWNRVDLSSPRGRARASRLSAISSSARPTPPRNASCGTRTNPPTFSRRAGPSCPPTPISDVLPWHYSGNHSHPTEKSVDTLKPIIEAFTKPGDVVLDPFAGSGSSLVAAALLGRQYIGIELEQKYCDLARRRLAGVTRYLSDPAA